MIYKSTFFLCSLVILLLVCNNAVAQNWGTKKHKDLIEISNVLSEGYGGIRESGFRSTEEIIITILKDSVDVKCMFADSTLLSDTIELKAGDRLVFRTGRVVPYNRPNADKSKENQEAYRAPYNFEIFYLFRDSQVLITKKDEAVTYYFGGGVPVTYNGKTETVTLPEQMINPLKRQ